MSVPRAGLLALSGTLLLLGQASAQQRQVQATAQNVLEPPSAAVRLADRITLKGNELGTMWTFENPPLEFWKTQYNFTATKEWLDKVRLSSVRYGESCSASFVSPEGLVMTNHHCARECIEAVSNQANDYVVKGFSAATREQELLCPELFLDQLIEIQNVTTRVHGVARAGATAKAISDAQEAEIEKIQDECEQQSKMTCQVVSLYHGGQYQLYKYKRFAPVKLVFAPELQAGFFGGDPDNFTYPRYDLDVSFVRAYDADGRTPANTSAHYFKWRAEGASRDELTFVTGNPGTTSRQIPVSELMYEKVFRHPFLIQLLQGQRDLFLQISKQGPQAEQQVRQQLFEVENSLKSFAGQYAGLQDSMLLGTKIRWEHEFRQKVQADPKLRAEFGDVWDKLADIQLEKLRTSPRLNLTNAEFIGAPHVGFASMLLGYIDASGKPEAQRPESFQGEKFAQVGQMLRSPMPIDPGIAQSLLALHIAMAARWLEPNDPLLRELVRQGETPEQAAARLAAASKILDAPFREGVIRGGASGIATNTDPLVRLARLMAQTWPALNERWPQLQAAERVQEERLAKALFAVYGTRLPPDATFTLRITDGQVRGYPYNGTVAPHATTFYGLFARSAEFGNEMPFTLAPTIAERRAAINMATPLNFVSTNDITGGNSGSPVIDKEARIVGLAFDSNMEALPNEFLYRNESGRSVHVHSAGILEALRSIYRTEALVRELTGTGTR
jgi:hypothetical protein